MLLVVDDEPVVLRAIVRALCKALPSGQIHTATTVHEAIALIERDLPLQGAIIDIRLGRRSGFDVIQHLRDTGSSLPVLVLTGADDAEKQRRAQLLGATYLSKPIQRDNVLAFWKHSAPQRYLQVIERTARVARLASREAELLGLLATGTPRGTLAEVMALAPNTIRSMCRRIRLKLGGRRIDDVISAMQQQCNLCHVIHDRVAPLDTKQS